jgi:hypothetical protein
MTDTTLTRYFAENLLQITAISAKGDSFDTLFGCQSLEGETGGEIGFESTPSALCQDENGMSTRQNSELRCETRAGAGEIRAVSLQEDLWSAILAASDPGAS